MKIYIILNTSKDQAILHLHQVVEKLQGLGAQCFLDPSLQQVVGEIPAQFLPAKHVMGEMDLLITIGGDGTIIHGAKYAIHYHLPILGINIGRVGFLAQVDIGDLEPLERLMRGEYTLEDRMLLKGTLHRANGSEIHLPVSTTLCSPGWKRSTWWTSMWSAAGARWAATGRMG